jgi:UDP-N-acetylglucosamine acyltransferase
MSTGEVFIHPTSTVHSQAQLEEGVWIGPDCFIGEKVTIHRNARFDGHVHVDGHTEIGEDCRFSPYSVIGTEPQDVGYRGQETLVKIGSRNVFREFITVHRGTEKGGGETTIGDDNYFMAYSHIAHDCRVGDGTIFINAATLGGHVSVDDFATISGFSAVHQFCRVGKYAYVGGFTVITQDVLPFSRVAGMRPVLIYGLNGLGLRRRGFSRERLRALKEMFKIIFYSDLNTTQAVEKITKLFPPHEDREEIISFIESSKRGIIKKASAQWENESEF